MVKHSAIHSGNICLVYSFLENIITTLKQTIGDSAVITLDWFQDYCITLYAILVHNETLVFSLQTPTSSLVPSLSNSIFCNIATE